jgi:hypothetical protein
MSYLDNTSKKYKSHSPTYKYYSEKPETVFTKPSDTPELTILKFESQTFITPDRYNSYKKGIGERIKYLIENLDEDQDQKIFELSKKTMEKFIEYVKTTEVPLISVDNVGNIIFEWRNYNSYDILIMLFRTDEKLSLTGIKKNKCLLKISGIIEEVSDIFLQL